jgi:hypothetical protein
MLTAVLVVAIPRTSIEVVVESPTCPGTACTGISAYAVPTSEIKKKITRIAITTFLVIFIAAAIPMSPGTH